MRVETNLMFRSKHERLATVEVVDSVSPLMGAEGKLDVVMSGGWTAVTQAGAFHVGNKVVLIRQGASMPEVSDGGPCAGAGAKPCYWQFLCKSGWTVRPKTYRTICGPVYADCVMITLKCLNDDGQGGRSYEEGLDVTNMLGAYPSEHLLLPIDFTLLRGGDTLVYRGSVNPEKPLQDAPDKTIEDQLEKYGAVWKTCVPKKRSPEVALFVYRDKFLGLFPNYKAKVFTTVTYDSESWDMIDARLDQMKGFLKETKNFGMFVKGYLQDGIFVATGEMAVAETKNDCLIGPWSNDTARVALADLGFVVEGSPVARLDDRDKTKYDMIEDADAMPGTRTVYFTPERKWYVDARV